MVVQTIALIIPVNKRNKSQLSIMKNRTQSYLKATRISGEARYKTIYDFPHDAAVARVLTDFDFLADKQKIIQHTELKQTTRPDSNEVLSVLQ